MAASRVGGIRRGRQSSWHRLRGRRGKKEEGKEEERKEEGGRGRRRRGGGEEEERREEEVTIYDLHAFIAHDDYLIVRDLNSACDFNSVSSSPHVMQ